MRDTFVDDSFDGKSFHSHLSKHAVFSCAIWMLSSFNRIQYSFLSVGFLTSVVLSSYLCPPPSSFKGFIPRMILGCLTFFFCGASQLTPSKKINWYGLVSIVGIQLLVYPAFGLMSYFTTRTLCSPFLSMGTLFAASAPGQSLLSEYVYAHHYIDGAISPISSLLTMPLSLLSLSITFLFTNIDLNESEPVTFYVSNLLALGVCFFIGVATSSSHASSTCEEQIVRKAEKHRGKSYYFWGRALCAFLLYYISVSDVLHSSSTKMSWSQIACLLGVQVSFHSAAFCFTWGVSRFTCVADERIMFLCSIGLGKSEALLLPLVSCLFNTQRVQVEVLVSVSLFIFSQTVTTMFFSTLLHRWISRTNCIPGTAHLPQRLSPGGKHRIRFRAY